jgi:hypothetical protein
LQQRKQGIDFILQQRKQRNDFNLQQRKQRIDLKGLSHEIDFKNFDRTLKNFT